MSYLKQIHQVHEEPVNDDAHQDHRPYWKRAHRDWRVWLGVILMIAGMFVYVMSQDLSLRLRSRPQQPPPVTDKK